MITYYAISEAGERKENEDNILECHRDKEVYCFSVADGLGGSEHGGDASGFVNRVIEEQFWSNPVTDHLASDMIQRCQERLLMEKKKNRIGDALTTIVLLIISGEKIQWAHVGDSRLYYFRKGHLYKRTKDHSVPQLLATAGEIGEEEIRFHPDRNKLLKAVGEAWNRNTVESSGLLNCTVDDSFLLCSDGFWEYINEDEMERYLQKAESVEKWIMQMKNHVLYAGVGKNADNFSAIGIWNRK